MIDINQPTRDKPHKRLVLERERRRKREERGGMAYFVTGLVVLVMGALGLLFFGLSGDTVGMICSSAAITAGIGAEIFGGLIVRLFGARRGSRTTSDTEDGTNAE